MRIYPTTYRYNAPYRGPRNYIELNKLLTSIGYDIDTAISSSKLHKEMINHNFIFSLYKEEQLESNMGTYGEINGQQESYASIRELANSINVMNSKLDSMLKNI